MLLVAISDATAGIGGRLYFSSSAGLRRVDPNTGQTSVVTFSYTESYAVDPIGGDMYVLDCAPDPCVLSTIERSGTVVTSVPTEHLTSMAFDPVTQRLLAIRSVYIADNQFAHSVVSVDPTTGTSTLVHFLGATMRTMFIDQSTGNVMLVGGWPMSTLRLVAPDGRVLSEYPFSLPPGVVAGVYDPDTATLLVADSELVAFPQNNKPVARRVDIADGSTVQQFEFPLGCDAHGIARDPRSGKVYFSCAPVASCASAVATLDDNLQLLQLTYVPGPALGLQFAPSRRIVAACIGVDHGCLPPDLRGGYLASELGNVLDDDDLYPQAEHVEVLRLDAAAGQANVALLENTLAKMSTIVRDEDLFILFLSAHGGQTSPTAPGLNESPVEIQYDVGDPAATIPNSGDEYLFLDDGVGQARYVDDQLRSFFDSSVWSNVDKLVVIDACYGGGWWPDLAALPRTGFIAGATEGTFQVMTVDLFVALQPPFCPGMTSPFARGIIDAFESLPDFPQPVTEQDDLVWLLTILDDSMAVSAGEVGSVQDYPDPTWWGAEVLPFEPGAHAVSTPDFDLEATDPVPYYNCDLDGDGMVGGRDLGLLLAAWGTSTIDIDGDGACTASDLGLLLAAWTQ